MISRVNASTFHCRPFSNGAPAKKDGERIVVLEGSDGIRFHFRKRLMAPHDLASELIEIASGKRIGKR